jgi:hypothetical protein
VVSPAEGFRRRYNVARAGDCLITWDDSNARHLPKSLLGWIFGRPATDQLPRQEFAKNRPRIR